MTTDNDNFVAWFRAASPYIHVHRGSAVVVRIDAAVVGGDAFVPLAHDLALLSSLGVKLILVYGARRGIDERLKRAGIEPRFHRGRRLTDAAAMEAVKEVAGRALIDIQARLSMGLGNTPMAAAGLRVASGNYVAAKPLGVIDGVDHHWSGEIRRIDTAAIADDLNNNEIVVVPPLGYSVTGEAFNLSADELAADIAAAMRADKLIYLLEDETAAALSAAAGRGGRSRQEAAALLADMPPETAAARCLRLSVQACEAGVARIHLLARGEDGAIVKELFSKDGVGVMVTASGYDELRQAAAADIGGILDLIAPLEQEGSLAQRSREKLELEIERFTVLSRDGVIIACAALYPYGDCAELACLAVSPPYRNGGRGLQLLRELERRAKSLRIRRLFVLTTRAEHWFLEHGFVESSLDELPVEKQETYNYQRNSRALVKKL